MNKKLPYLIFPLVLVVSSPLFAEGTAAEQNASAPAAASAAELTAEISVGTGVENRELVGAADSFTSDVPQVVGWTRIKGAQEPTEVKHVWKFNGKETNSVSLSVQSSSYRTYSRKNLNGQVGSWTLEVVDADGRVIASKNFEVTSAPQK